SGSVAEPPPATARSAAPEAPTDTARDARDSRGPSEGRDSGDPRDPGDARGSRDTQDRDPRDRDPRDRNSRRRDRFDEESDTERLLDSRGRILRDNVYGTIDDDVWRRDFTANALYYNIADFSLWDYVGGFEDIKARRLRLIGDPETRYREDPVRMLRAARFEAKLGFDMEPQTSEPLARLLSLLPPAPPPRLFDEAL